MYDVQALPALEAQANAAAAHLARTLPPVQQWQGAALAGFDVSAPDATEQAHRHQATERLLTAMQAYYEAVAAYNAQLVANLTETEATAQREAARAAYYRHEWALTQADLEAEQALQLRQLETFTAILNRRAD